MKIEGNLTFQLYRERLAQQTEDVQKKLKDGTRAFPGFDDLIKIKKNNMLIERGDVFVVQPKKGLYFYGRVLNTNVSTRVKPGGNYAWHGVDVVCVYNLRTTEPTLRDFTVNAPKILIKPFLTVHEEFARGYYYKVGNIPFVNDVVPFDYGFHNDIFGYMIDEFGDELDYMPSIIYAASLDNRFGIVARLNTEFIIDPSLMELSDGANQSCDEYFSDTADEDIEEDETSDTDNIFAVIQEEIAPFFLTQNDDVTSLCLNIGDYKPDAFAFRYDEGFEGNGYDWESLAQVLICEELPELETSFDFDSEAGMLCVLSSDADAVVALAKALKSVCEDDVRLAALVAKTELQ